MQIASVVDQPREGDFCYRQRIPVKGWVYAGYRHDKIKRISVHAPNGEIGATSFLYPRADVALAHQLPPDTRTGFRLLAVFQPAGPPPPVVGIEVRVEFADGTSTPLAGIHLQILRDDHIGAPLGALCDPRHTAALPRGQLAPAAHPPETADADCIELIADYLPPGISLLDVGCGNGAYCEPLRARGFSWIGCETDLACAHQLALRSRPHRIILPPRWPWSRYRLPAARGEFDAVIALDVLPYVADPAAFLAQLRRVTRRHVVLSVFNAETLPFLAGRQLAPLAMLEPGPRRWFSRFSLQPFLADHFRHVEVLDGTPLPLPSTDGLPLPSRLFALCEI
jgi:SAM-dependent methyltransferase